MIVVLATGRGLSQFYNGCAAGFNMSNEIQLDEHKSHAEAVFQALRKLKKLHYDDYMDAVDTLHRHAKNAGRCARELLDAMVE